MEYAYILDLESHMTGTKHLYNNASLYDQAFYLSNVPLAELVVLSVSRRFFENGVRKYCQPDLWVLNCNIDYGGRYKIGGDTTGWRERPPLQVHLYPPGTVFFEDPYAGRKPAPIRSCHALFKVNFQELFAPFFAGETRFAKIIDKDGIVPDTLKVLTEYANRSALHSQLSLQAVFLSLLAQLVENTRLTTSGEWVLTTINAATSNFFSVEITDYLQAHLDERITLAKLAKRFKVSLSCLTHRFRRETGTTPMDTLLSFRIERAKALLLRGEKLAHIYHVTGFCDEYHLSKSFKQHTGLTPRQFLLLLGSIQNGT